MLFITTTLLPTRAGHWPLTMATGPTIATWRPPNIPGIPASLQENAENIRGAYVNSGRMSGGLGRLQSTTYLFKRAAAHNTTATGQARDGVRRILAQMQGGVKKHLLDTQARLDREVLRVDREMDSLKDLVVAELDFTQQNVDRDVVATMGEVESVLAGVGQGTEQELQAAISSLKQCSSDLERDINAAESDYMASLSQILAYSSWSSAWPEAVRTVQQLQRTNAVQMAPPRYLATTAQGSIVTERRPEESDREADAL
ncbi:hypothetical protein CF319_g5437 [Tilletia indica]|uniref:Uncharacterized protein n=1 Tax=Tilletia indica TaxID=43049 RepID=A0A177TPD8_9BASI|nr:hypothetical protein CF319_g5437 [Tilletia indica]KAE8258170.1 hypothetical protein A4X13_0g1853 [Tilletia indica]